MRDTIGEYFGHVKRIAKGIPGARDFYRALRFPVRMLCNFQGVLEETYVGIKYRRRGLQTIRWDSFLVTETEHDPYIRRISFGRMKRPTEQEILFQELITQKKPIIFDVGANIGILTLLLCQTQGSTVYSFEPGSRAHDCLKRNIEQNNIANAVPLHMGLSNMERELFIGPPCGEQHPRYRSKNLKTGLYSVHADPDSEDARKYGEMARFTTIDAFCSKNDIKDLNFIKIDVEGHEVNVLQGSETVLYRARPICQSEFNSMTIQIAGKEPEELFNILRDLGYSTFILDRRCFVEISYPALLERCSASTSDLITGRSYIGAEIFAFPVEQTTFIRRQLDEKGLFTITFAS